MDDPTKPSLRARVQQRVQEIYNTPEFQAAAQRAAASGKRLQVSQLVGEATRQLMSEDAAAEPASDGYGRAAGLVGTGVVRGGMGLAGAAQEAGQFMQNPIATAIAKLAGRTKFGQGVAAALPGAPQQNMAAATQGIEQSFGLPQPESGPERFAVSGISSVVAGAPFGGGLPAHLGNALGGLAEQSVSELGGGQFAQQAANIGASALPALLGSHGTPWQGDNAISALRNAKVKEAPQAPPSIVPENIPQAAAPTQPLPPMGRFQQPPAVPAPITVEGMSLPQTGMAQEGSMYQMLGIQPPEQPITRYFPESKIGLGDAAEGLRGTAQQGPMYGGEQIPAFLMPAEPTSQPRPQQSPLDEFMSSPHLQQPGMLQGRINQGGAFSGLETNPGDKLTNFRNPVHEIDPGKVGAADPVRAVEAPSEPVRSAASTGEGVNPRSNPYDTSRPSSETPDKNVGERVLAIQSKIGSLDAGTRAAQARRGLWAELDDATIQRKIADRAAAKAKLQAELNELTPRLTEEHRTFLADNAEAYQRVKAHMEKSFDKIRRGEIELPPEEGGAPREGEVPFRPKPKRKVAPKRKPKPPTDI